MALKRATKSVPLTGGTTEEAQDFVLEPAGMAFVKNGRYPATDRCIKARSLKEGVVTGYSNFTNDLYGSWGYGNKLALVGNNEVSYSRDGGASWEVETQKTDLLGIERILTTAEQAGGHAFSWAPVGNYTAGTLPSYEVYGYAVAFERITQVHDTNSNTRDVVIQAYDSDGTLLEEQVLANCNSPNVKPADGYAVVWYSTSGGVLKSRLVFHAANDVFIGGEQTSSAESIQQFCQIYDTATEQWQLSGAGQNFGAMRLGYSYDMKANNAALVAFNRVESADGVVAWKEDNGTGRIRVRRHTAGTLIDNYVEVAIDNATYSHQVLDVTQDFAYAYVLYARINKSTGESDLYCWRATLGTFGGGPSSSFAVNLKAVQDAVFVNGSVRTDTDRNAWIAVTRADGNPLQTIYDTFGGHRIEWFRIPAGVWDVTTTTDREGILHSHRLVSNIAIDTNVVGADEDAHFCAQQWDNWNPDTTGSGFGVETALPGIVPTHKKPVTTLLIRPYYDANTRNVPIASFDAGQSKGTIAGLDEQSIHKNGDLYYFSNRSPGSSAYNQFWYGNRVLLTASDEIYWLQKSAAPVYGGPSDPNADRRRSILPGSARFALYYLNSTVPTNVALFPDGMLLGTSAPTWYDGTTYVMEAHPFDSPEIVGAVEKGGTNAVTFMAYNPLPGNDAIPKAYNAVIGFSDANGRVHRSAPSTTIYLGNMTPTESNAPTVTLYVTPPVSMNRLGTNYFVEIYESLSGEAPQLAATKAIPRLDGSARLTVEFLTNIAPAGGVATHSLLDYRGSKILYTDGGVLAADPWPNFDIIVKSGRRLFAHSISDPNTIYYSKTFEQNVAPEFSASLTVTLGNEVITAMGTIDDKVILFTEDGCWVMSGVGPDNTGANGDFFVEKLPFTAGCVEQRSVLSYQDGLAFYSCTNNEFVAITRDLLMVDIGEAIKEMSGGITTILAGAVVAAEEELRFYCDYTQPQREVAVSNPTGTRFQPPRAYLTKNTPGTINNVIFAYNFKYQKWSIRTIDFAMSNGILRNGVIVYGKDRFGLISASYVFREEIDGEYRFSDKMYWETPDIKVNQLQDFGRFYSATILGKYLSSWSDTGSGVESGDLQVVVRYDYEGPDATVDTHLFRANVDFDPANGQSLQLEIPITNQKCQSIKFEISEVATTKLEVFEPTYTTGQGFELVAIDLHYGAKGGSARLPSRRRR